MLSIGEFSRVSRITIKALRHYHEQGILVPELVDEMTGYRYYGAASRQRAAAISELKEMGFSLSEIGALLAGASDDADLAEALSQKLDDLEDGIREQRARQRRIKEFLGAIRNGEDAAGSEEAVREEEIPDILIFGLRFQGRYDEIGRLIGRVYRMAGRHAAGGPFCLYYDGEYKEESADIELCVPARSRMGIEGLDCRILAGGTASTFVHRGPYEILGKGYEKLYDHVRRNGRSLKLPSREVYLKGPGMIVRGDPVRFRTKLEIFHD